MFNESATPRGCQVEPSQRELPRDLTLAWSRRPRHARGVRALSWRQALGPLGGASLTAPTEFVGTCVAETDDRLGSGDCDTAPWSSASERAAPTDKPADSLPAGFEATSCKGTSWHPTGLDASAEDREDPLAVGIDESAEDPTTAGSSAEPRVPPPAHFGSLPFRLADGHIPDLEPAALALQVHSALKRVNGWLAQADIEVGRGLLRLQKDVPFRHLGVSRFDDLCLSIFGFSGAHGRDLVAIAESLPQLPCLRAACHSGALPRSKAREVARHATPATDAHWTRLALTLSSRQLKQAIRNDKAKDSPRGEAPPTHLDDPADFVTTSWRSRPEDAIAYKSIGLPMVRQVVGRHLPEWQCVEAMAAEVISSFGTGAEADDGEPLFATTPRDAEPDAIPDSMDPPDENAACPTAPAPGGCVRHPHDGASPRHEPSLPCDNAACERARPATHFDPASAPTAPADGGCVRHPADGSASPRASAGSPATRERSQPAGATRVGRARVASSRGLLRARQVSEARTTRKLLARAALMSRLDMPNVEAPATAWPLHEAMQGVVRVRRQVEWARARLLTLMYDRALYRELGHERMEHWAERALAMSPGELIANVKLVHSLEWHPDLSRAWREGQVGERHVNEIVRVSQRDNDAAWLAFAERATWKRLLDEVEWHVHAAATNPRYRAETGGRPDFDALDTTRPVDWRAALGRKRDGARFSPARESARRERESTPVPLSATTCRRTEGGACAGPEPASSVEEELELPPSAKRSLERVLVRFRGPAWVARLFRHAIEAIRRLASHRPPAMQGGPAPERTTPSEGAPPRPGSVADDPPPPARRSAGGSDVAMQGGPAPERTRTYVRTRARRGSVADDPPPPAWLEEGECVHVMVLFFARIHVGPEVEAHARRHAVMERDGWRCVMPHCGERMRLNVHHVEYKSRGGQKVHRNEITLCWLCHHRLVHGGGHVKIFGEAPHGLTFLVGFGRYRQVWRRGLREVSRRARERVTT